MTAEVGRSSRRGNGSGKGRAKGTPNRITASVKEMVLSALNELGGERYLVEQGRANPQAFMTLIGRIIPSEIKASLDSGPPIIRIINGIVMPEDWTNPNVEIVSTREDIPKVLP